jgi:hypothetical protein
VGVAKRCGSSAAVQGLAYDDFALIETQMRDFLVAGTPGLESPAFSDPVEFAARRGG